MRIAALSALALLLSAASPARAQPLRDLPDTSHGDRPGATLEGTPPGASRDPTPPAHTGFTGAVRLGTMFPMAKAEPDRAMSDFFSTQFTAILEAGYRPIPEAMIGAYGGASGGSGSSTLRAGVEAMVFFLPGSLIDPFIGYGIGWESGSGSFGGDEGTYRGLEIARLSAGFDARLEESFGIGPVVDLGIGRYSSFSGSTRGGARDESLGLRAAHQWLMVGVRGVLFP